MRLTSLIAGLSLTMFPFSLLGQDLAAQGSEAIPPAGDEASGEAPADMPAADAEAAGPTAAEEAPGFAPIPITDQRIADFLWQNRLLVVFAETPLDPSYIRQIELLSTRPEVLAVRDVLVLTDTDPAARTPMRAELRPRGFAMVIVDKDGKVLLRKPSPWDLREITRAIDKTPLRQEELRDARDAEAARAREKPE